MKPHKHEKYGESAFSVAGPRLEGFATSCMYLNLIILYLCNTKKLIFLKSTLGDIFLLHKYVLLYIKQEISFVLGSISPYNQSYLIYFHSVEPFSALSFT